MSTPARWLLPDRADSQFALVPRAGTFVAGELGPYEIGLDISTGRLYRETGGEVIDVSAEIQASLHAAETWAEGLAADVAALGGTDSAKGHAETTAGLKADVQVLHDAAVVAKGAAETAAEAAGDHVLEAEAIRDDLGDVAEALASVELGDVPVVSIGQSSPANVRQTGTFSGWNAPIGVLNGTGRFAKLTVPAWDGATPVSNVKVVIHEATYNGTVLATGTLALPGPTSAPTEVRIDFGEVVTFNNVVGWAALITDGHTGHQQGGPLTQTAALRGRWYFRTLKNLNDDNWVIFTTDQTLDFTIEIVDTAYDVAYTPAFDEAVAERVRTVLREPEADVPTLLLPTRLYAMEGAAVGLYDAAITGPTEAGDMPNVLVDRTRGRNYDHGWNWLHDDSPALNGAIPLTVYVSQGSGEIVSETIPIRCFPETTGAGITRKVLKVGDSTTASGTAIDYAAAFLAARPGLQVNWIGTQGAGANKHEGHSGQTLAWLLGNDASPFVYSGFFDLAQYLTDNSLSLAADDWFMLDAGINDLFGLTTDAQVVAAAEAAKGLIDAAIADAQTAVPGLRLAICTMLPSSERPHALGNVYTGNTDHARYKRNRRIWLAAMMAEYDTSAKEAADVYWCPMGECVDPVSGFPATMATIHPLTTETFSVGGDYLHPGLKGYEMAAHPLASFLAYHQ